tara:strand:+ start:875 stop:1021 length:147 start_codon:yes stop_codon:yes gene_type:complete
MSPPVLSPSPTVMLLPYPDSFSLMLVISVPDDYGIIEVLIFDGEFLKL